MNLSFSRKLDSSVAARLGMCAAALAGTAATVTDANAIVVRSTTPIAVPATADGVYINFLTGATSTTSFTGFDFNPYSGSGSLLFYWGGATAANAGVAATTTGPYLDLAVGSVISSASIFSQSANGANSETSAFLTTGTHTLGFKFTNEATSAINYGYLTMTTTGATGFPAVITSYAYENTGAAITVSAVPEPESVLMFSLGALALGAVNLRRLRRDRRNQSH